ncbi:efflux transporter outer membrane subunit [Sandaracinobacter sp. RS1-74]|uniref:efflux transporter outer membrane subunit n=1 Tax=Sandaracinobacteroides sayramensis TaxID=2913411 RepID=UPI001ED9E7C8|nr:efflux transporter outer membrane subunit [Sandaracinobacteroides sayramensis]MCG2840675.1 efflux transporter outer membrane subunit [Sandaracinobacteroides sayramensis]
MSMAHRFLPKVTALLLAGCTTGGHASADPAITSPAHLSADRPGSPLTAPDDWWSGFRSAELSELIGRARSEGFDVAASEARVRRALAGTRIAGAALLPDLNANVAAEHSDGDPAFSIGLATRYELDLWGRNHASRRGALAMLDAAEHDRNAVALIVETETAAAWAATVAATERRAIAAHNLHAARRILGLVESRQRAGMANPLELGQQRALVASLEQRLAQIERERAFSRATLASLLGRVPQGFDVATTTLTGVGLPSFTPELPSAVLLRRPDIAAAERRLAAADADVALARAAMWPQITLRAGGLFESGRLPRLFDNPIYSLAFALTAPIFAGGRLAGERDYAVARREELWADYHGAIVAAFAEVEQALSHIDTLERETDAQTEALRQAEIAARLAESRYQAGAETLLVMLDAQRILYAAQEDALTLRQARIRAAIILYRSVGGRLPT